MDAADIADLAELYVQRQARLAERRRQLEGRLYRVHRAMLQWEDWQDEQERPIHLRRPMPTPLLSYDSLKALHALLLDKLAELGARTAEYRSDGS